MTIAEPSAGFDEWIEAISTDEGFFLKCDNGHRSLPPRRRCPNCASNSLKVHPLPDSGVVETYSQVHIPTPAFEADAPYILAIANFGGVRLTGQIHDASTDDIEIGSPVRIEVRSRRTTDAPLITFIPT